MRLLTLGLLALLITFVAAWSKEDQEIFRLRQEIIDTEGPDVTFYEFLGVPQSATQDDINKAYRTKSRTLHPDKVKRQFKDKKGGNSSKNPSKAEIKAATKAASDRFARLGIIAEILRGAGRERYDHFLSNGFPTWKGTGYYYARFRPGLGSVLIGLFIFCGGGIHYLTLYMSWQREQKYIERLIAEGRKGWRSNIPGLDSLGSGSGSGSGTATPVPAAEDSDAPPVPRNRRERRMAGKMEAKESKAPKKAKVVKPSPPTPTSTGEKRRRVTASNGMPLLVDSVGNVYVEQRDDEDEGVVHEILLDPSSFPKPTLKSTALYRLPIHAVNTIKSRLMGGQ